MATENSTEVLIVGAGPTGLAAAAVLAKQGVRVRIIDKNPTRSDKTKALGVQVGTLNCLEAALDPEIVKAMIAAGWPATFANMHLDDRPPIQLQLGDIPGDKKFLLILSQSENERFLEEYCAKHGLKVERSTELLDLSENGSGVVAKMRKANGKTEEVAASFVIGCDGAHSVVRQILAIPFKGAAYTGDFILGDITLDWPWKPGEIRAFLNERGTIASFPLNADGRYRLIIIQKNAVPDARSEISEEEFKSLVSHISGGKIIVKESFWLTRFRVHHRVVDHLRKGRVFLSGDAAHIHSPVGAQGMNTGIQDSINLAFKLTAVLRGEKPYESLDSYEKERLPVVKDVVRFTDFFFKAALTKEGAVTKAARKYLIPKLANAPWIRRKIVTWISEVKIAKREISRYPAV